MSIGSAVRRAAEADGPQWPEHVLVLIAVVIIVIIVAVVVVLIPVGPPFWRGLRHWGPVVCPGGEGGQAAPAGTDPPPAC